MANKFDSKYKDMMSHIEVDDEMRARILKNVEEAAKNPIPRAKVTGMPKAQIISMVAAAAVVLVIGGVLLNLAMNGGSKSSESESFTPNHRGEETAAGVAEENWSYSDADEVIPEDVHGTNGDSDAETAEPMMPEVDAEETEGEEFAYVSYIDVEGTIHIVSGQAPVDEFISSVNAASGESVDSDRFDTDSEHVYFLINDGNDSYTIRISEKYILIDDDECRMILPGHENLAEELIDFCINNGG